jgi:hypothetical protein
LALLCLAFAGPGAHADPGERDAVVSAFNFSDLRQATNVVNHRVEYFYQLNQNIQMGFTGLIGRQLVTASSPTPERWLKRLQFDMIYKF